MGIAGALASASIVNVASGLLTHTSFATTNQEVVDTSANIFGFVGKTEDGKSGKVLLDFCDALMNGTHVEAKYNIVKSQARQLLEKTRNLGRREQQDWIRDARSVLACQNQLAEELKVEWSKFEREQQHSDY